MLSYTVVKKKNMKESSIQGSSGLFVKNTDSQKLSPDTCPIPDSCDAIKDLLKRIDQKFLMSDEVQHDENKSPPSESLQDVEKKATDKKKHKISTAKSSVKTQSLQPSEIQMKNSKAKTPKGFEFEPIKIDEYGFFRCISKSLFDDQNAYHSILEKSIAYIRKNLEIFKLHKQNLDTYLESIRETKNFENIIYMAAALSYRFNLYFYHPSSSKFETIYAFDKYDKNIFILKDTFYYLLKKLDDSPFTASEMKINLFKHKPIKVEDPVVEQPSPPKISALREDKYKHNTQNTNQVKNMKETSQNGIVCQKSVKPSQGPKRVQDYSNVQKLEKGKNKYINNKSSNVGNAEKPCVETTSVNYMTHHYKSRSLYGRSSRNSNFRKTDSNFLPHPNNLNVSDNYLRQPQPIRIEPSVSVKETNIQAKSPKKSSQVKHDDKDDVNKIITWSEVSNDTCEVGSEKTCEIDKKDRIPEAETNLRGRSQYPSNRRGNRGRRPRYNYDRGAASASVPFTTFVDMVDQYGQIYTVPVVPFLYYVPVLPSNNPGDNYVVPFDSGCYYTYPNIETIENGKLKNIDNHPEDATSSMICPENVVIPRRYDTDETPEERLELYKSPDSTENPPLFEINEPKMGISRHFNQAEMTSKDLPISEHLNLIPKYLSSSN